MRVLKCFVLLCFLFLPAFAERYTKYDMKSKMNYEENGKTESAYKSKSGRDKLQQTLLDSLKTHDANLTVCQKADIYETLNMIMFRRKWVGYGHGSVQGILWLLPVGIVYGVLQMTLDDYDCEYYKQLETYRKLCIEVKYQK